MAEGNAWARPDLRITGFTLRDKPMDRGGLLLGFFDIEVANIVKLMGCSLVLLPGEDKPRAWPPAIPGPLGERRAVRLINSDLRRQMRDVAIDCYRALGGRRDAPAASDDPNNIEGS